MKCILITGALGQIGSELTVSLRKHFGDSLVVATDVRLPTDTMSRAVLDDLDSR